MSERVSEIAAARRRSVGCDCAAPYLPHPLDRVSARLVVIAGKIVHDPLCRVRLVAAAPWN